MRTRTHVRTGKLAVAAAIMLSMWCTDWPTRFERIDADQLRVLDFTFANLSDSTAQLCDFAPGDSVLLTAYFCGKPLESIEWEVSWNVQVDLYGSDTAFDRQPLVYEYVPIDSSAFSDSTEMRAIKFKIPDDVLEDNASIYDAALTALGLGELDASDLLALIDYYAQLSSDERKSDPQVAPLHTVMEQYAPAFMQALSVPVRIYARANDVYRIRTTLVVRCNRLLRDVPGVFVNHNPEIRFVGVHKVKAPPPANFTVQGMDRADTTYCLFSTEPAASRTASRLHQAGVAGPAVLFTDTITIDTGFAYYVAVDSGVYDGVDLRDTAQGVIYNEGVPTIGSPAPETYYTLFFYQFDADEITGLDNEEMMQINSMGGIDEDLLPPLDTGLTHATLWVQVQDSYFGGRNRPVGSSLVETRLHFEYTPGYADSVSSL
ncbi:MAG: hypothetical protein GF331_10145 [Chitinivibrionales bacterium]|nr:hypothetical protein [Chitinivibrionales bacterium]